MSYTAEEFRRAWEGFRGRTSVPWPEVVKGLEEACEIAARVMEPGVIAGALINLDRSAPTDDEFEAAIREALTHPKEAGS